MKKDFRRTTEWKTKLFLFPKALETCKADIPYLSDSIIEYSRFFTKLEYRKQATINNGYITIYRKLGSDWDIFIQDFEKKPPRIK